MVSEFKKGDRLELDGQPIMILDVGCFKGVNWFTASEFGEGFFCTSLLKNAKLVSSAEEMAKALDSSIKNQMKFLAKNGKNHGELLI